MAAPKSSSSKHHGKVRMLDGKPVKVVYYDGHNVGHGMYFAGEVEGKLVMIPGTDKPAKFRSIGTLQ